MNNYVNFIKRYRKPLLGLLVVINILALLGVFQVKINPEFGVFMPVDSKHKKILDEMNKYFPSSEQIMFLVEQNNKDITVDLITKFRNFQTFLESINEIKLINGPTPESLSTGSININLDNISTKELIYLKEYYEMLGKLSPVIKKDGKVYGVFTIIPADTFNNQDLSRIEAYLEEHNQKYYASGDLYLQQKVLDYIWMILLFIPPAAFLLILAVFRSQMGSLKSTFLSVLPAGLGALWTVGLIGWIGQEVSIVTVLAPIFTIVIGSADGLHFVSHVQDERSAGVNRITSIISTLQMVGIPMIITTVTSMAGFLSLLVMNTDAIKDLALFASIGIFLAGFITWYVLPLILTGKVELKVPRTKKALFTEKIKNLWGIPSILIVILVLAIAVIGLNRVNTEFNQLMFYKENTGVYQSFEKIMEINNGSIPVFLYIQTIEDPLSPSTANKIIKLEERLVSSKLVMKTISVYDFYSTVYAHFQNLEKPVYPDNPFIIEMINKNLTAGKDDPSVLLINRDHRVVRLMVFPANLKNETLDGINKIAETYSRDINPFKIEVSGVQYLMRELNQSMINNQTSSLLLAFFLIFILLFISLQKLKPSIISLLPIGFTVIILYGFLGWSGISLNVFTATIFCITIGVGIDYAIHFTSVWMSFKRKGLSSNEAVEKAYLYTSRPIMANALGLAIGLSALLLSPLMVHTYVSLLMWVSMISGVFLSLSFLPTILKNQ